MSADLTRTDVIKLIALATQPLNLRGVYLTSIDLSYLDFRNANLIGANLSGSKLHKIGRAHV